MTQARLPWPIADTVKPYHRHVFVCTGAATWPARIEEADGLLGRMASDVRSVRERLDPPPKVTATDEPAVGVGFDLLVFPERVRYHGVDRDLWAAIFDRHVIGGTVVREAAVTPLEGRWVFVCTHGARDDRCGACGPPLRRALDRATRAAGLQEVSVRGTSHVGGHKYAGNVLVYPEGVWYGWVRPADAERIVTEHLVAGRTVDELCRGRMAPGANPA